MRRQILAVTIGTVLAAAVLTPALYNNNAFAQVTAESRVLQAILGLTDQIKQQTTEIEGKYQDIILDLNLKKKFYAVEVSQFTSRIPGVGDTICPNDNEEACAFNVESMQIQCQNDPILVEEIRVDGVVTDISDKGITTPTNLLLDSGIGKIGATDTVNAVLATDCISGDLIVTGEKPQGLQFD